MIFLIAIKLELIPIFIDESGFINENTNFYSWIAKDFSIYSNVDKIEKFNLLMAVSPNKVIHFSIKDGSVESTYFNKFMQQLFENLGQNNISKYIIILDNVTIHLKNLSYE